MKKHTDSEGMDKKVCVRHKKNFKTLSRVFEDGVQGLVECELMVDIPKGTKVAVVCAFVLEGDGVKMTPFAMMMNGNPYEMLKPPNPDDE